MSIRSRRQMLTQLPGGSFIESTPGKQQTGGSDVARHGARIKGEEGKKRVAR